MSDLQCGNQKAVNLLSELEKKAGLIKRKRQGLGKPFHIDKQGNSEETADTGSKL
ncbi:MAG: hypothetical protein SPF89_09070 [Sphaerochaetaceae bacterium]|nr:hypothetical protein [Spirochaetales bacterium]MDY5500243.1 hypothetical protein [Sphaerochaetaceae bacterium]